MTSWELEVLRCSLMCFHWQKCNPAAWRQSQSRWGEDPGPRSIQRMQPEAADELERDSKTIPWIWGSLTSCVTSAHLCTAVLRAVTTAMVLWATALSCMGCLQAEGKETELAWVYVPRDFPGILNVWLDPGSQFIISCMRQRGARSCIGNKFLKLLQRKETKIECGLNISLSVSGILASLSFLCVVLLLLWGPYEHLVMPIVLLKPFLSLLLSWGCCPLGKRQWTW